MASSQEGTASSLPLLSHLLASTELGTKLMLIHLSDGVALVKRFNAHKDI